MPSGRAEQRFPDNDAFVFRHAVARVDAAQLPADPGPVERILAAGPRARNPENPADPERREPGGPATREI